jgi:hypothetical protein
MAKIAQDFTDETLEHTPEDATRFLNAIGAVASIRAALAHNGMTDEDIIEGRNLLFACLASPMARAEADTQDARAQRAASVELDEWDEPNFARYQAALVRHFPDAAQYVFGDLTASTGPSALKGVATFLARVQALDTGSDPSRGANKKEDKKAVALLAKRGLNDTERKRLQGLVNIALGPTEAAEIPTEPVQNIERRQALLKLKLWYNEWSSVAHATIKKRANLIRLGLATRHVAVSEQAPTADSPKATAQAGSH